MDIQKLGYCGFDCTACPVSIAQATGDDELRAKTAEEWSALYADYLGGKVLKAGDMHCEGCRAAQGIFTGCTTCPIRKCCRDRALLTCAECPEYASCGMLNGFFSEPSHRPAKENLDCIRKKQG